MSRPAAGRTKIWDTDLTQIADFFRVNVASIMRAATPSQCLTAEGKYNGTCPISHNHVFSHERFAIVHDRSERFKKCFTGRCKVEICHDYCILIVKVFIHFAKKQPDSIFSCLFQWKVVELNRTIWFKIFNFTCHTVKL